VPSTGITLALSAGSTPSAPTAARVMVIGHRCPDSTCAAMNSFAPRTTSDAPPAASPLAFQVELWIPAWALCAINS